MTGHLRRSNTSHDIVPPKIVFDQSPGLITKQNPVITGIVSDSLSGVASLEVVLDLSSMMDVAINTDGSFAVPVALALDGSSDGPHTLTFMAGDAAGNVSDPLAFDFSLITTAPQLTLDPDSVQDHGALTAGAVLSGIVSFADGDQLTAVSYAFDGGVSMPIAFDRKTGKFDEALNLSSLGVGQHSLALDVKDAAGNDSVETLDVSLTALPPLTIASLTPRLHALNVGVMFRPEIKFSRAVDVTTLTNSSFYATDLTGAVLASTISPLADGSGAWLFFSHPLPGASTITLHVEGDQIKAVDGQSLDAAGTGIAGSDFTETFSTVSTAGVPGDYHLRPRRRSRHRQHADDTR